MEEKKQQVTEKKHTSKHNKEKQLISELEEKLLRNAAELQNYKRRKDEEVSSMLRYSEEEILKDLLPMIDNLERAINMDDTNYNDEVSQFLKGFEMIYCEIKAVLKKHGVEEIDCLNKEFDPNYHQAVFMVEDKDQESNIVLEILQKGYIYNEKLLRPAMVKVNK